MYEIKGKTAVITGSGRGIGREIAIALAKEGARVVVNVKKRVDDGNETLRRVREYSDGIMVQADVSTRQGCRDLVKKSLDAYDKIHILVNNAGLGIGMPFLDTDDRLIEKMIGTNLMSNIYCSQEFGRIIQDNGCIVIISSLAGIRPMAMLSLYGTAKAAILKMAEYLAIELAPKHIRVNAVAPSVVKTKMGESLIDFLHISEEEYGLKHTLTGKMIMPEEVADAVVFLIKSQSITGQTIVIDSGQSLLSGLPSETVGNNSTTLSII
ncbi:MAG: SDR family oxidoreductase [Nitrososphaeria archaeon]|uniref:SDR family oxidoreductase n=1 Tax=Metallosphaera sp. TaxID=2020860 RepID=UPI0031773A1D